MRTLIILVNKIKEQLWVRIFIVLTNFISRIKIYTNGIHYNKGLKSIGCPLIHISSHAQCYIGKNFTMGNWEKLNASGIYAKCKIEVRNNATLIIGNNVGMTATTIMCFNHITIGNNVKIGVGTHIYDSDFHNINPIARLNGDSITTVNTNPIIIGNNVFIGAYCIILKGVTIGDNSVIGAGSVITKDIPTNEIWAGNPAKYIKKIQV